VSQAAAVQEGFGLLAIFGTSAVLPSGQRYMLAGSMTDVGAVYPTTALEYQAAQAFFSAQPSPAQVMIARMFSTAVPAELMGAAPDQVLADYNAINNGSLSLTVDGTAVNLTAIDLTAAASLNAVATAVQTKLVAVKAGSTVTYSGGRFIIRSGTTGIASTLAFPTTPGTGTDLAPLMELRQTDGATLTQGAAAETVAQSLANVNAIYSDWYMGLLATNPSDADIQALGTFVLANQKTGFYTTSAGGALVQTTTTDIGSVLKTSTNGRMFGLFDNSGVSPFAAATAAGVAATVDFNGDNTTQTLMFKVLPGVKVGNLSTTQKQVLDSKNYNYYDNVGGNPMLQKGVMADGTWFDQVQGLDWLSRACQDAVFSVLYGAKKVQQTDKGMTRFVHALESVFNQAVANGLLAPGVWNGTGIGQINTGDMLPKGYYIYAPSVNTQSQAIRNTRQAPPISILAKGAGAIQGLNILINFQQ
jgi:hypothetical protein